MTTQSLFLLGLLFCQSTWATTAPNKSDTEFAFVLLHGDMDYGERSFHKFTTLTPIEKERLVPYFCAEVDNPDERVRDNAASLLTEIGPTAMPCLTEALKDKSDGVKFHVLWGLPKLPRLRESDKATQDNILHLLESPNPNLRRESVIALGKVGYPSKETIETLKNIYRTDAGLKSHAACALAEIGDLEEGLPLLQKDIQNNINCIGRLGAKARPLIPDLISLGKNNMSEGLIITLGKIGKDAAPTLPLLIAEFNKGGYNRTYCANAIVSIGVATKDVVSIIDLISRYSFGTDAPSFSSFGEKDAKRIFPALLEADRKLLEENTKQGNSCTLTWADQRSVELAPHIKDELLTVFASPQPAYCGMFRALAKLGPEAAKPIASYLKHDNNVVRLYAVNALKEMGPQAADALPELLEFIKESHKNRYNDLNAVNYAYETVGRIGEKAFPHLQKILASDTSSTWPLHAMGYMPAQERIIEYILSYAKHPNHGLRLKALETLKRLHAYPGKCVPVLIDAMNDSDSVISNEAVRTLETFGTEAKSAIPALKKKLNDAVQSKDANQILSLAQALNLINDSSMEVNNLVLSALASIDLKGRLQQINVFKKIGRIPDKYVNGIFEQISTLDGYGAALITEQLIDSKLLTDKQLISLMNADNVGITNAAFQILCETGTQEAKDACIKYARSPKNPHRFSK